MSAQIIENEGDLNRWEAVAEKRREELVAIREELFAAVDDPNQMYLLLDVMGGKISIADIARSVQLHRSTISRRMKSYIRFLRKRLKRSP